MVGRAKIRIFSFCMTFLGLSIVKLLAINLEESCQDPLAGKARCVACFVQKGNFIY